MSRFLCTKCGWTGSDAKPFGHSGKAWSCPNCPYLVQELNRERKMDIVDELREAANEIRAQKSYSDKYPVLLDRAAAEIESLRAACKGTTVSCVCGGQGEIDKLRAELAEAKEHSIKNIPFYRLSIHSLRDSIVRLLWAYKHSEGCERAKEENKTNFQPTCTCVDSDAIEYGAQTLFNTEQVAKAIEALAAMQEGK